MVPVYICIPLATHQSASSLTLQFMQQAGEVEMQVVETISYQPWWVVHFSSVLSNSNVPGTAGTCR